MVYLLCKMFASSVFIFVLILIFFANYNNVNADIVCDEELKKCKEQKSYSIKDAKKLEIGLNYDPWLLPDLTCAKNMCKAQKTYEGIVALKFTPGYSVRLEKVPIAVAHNLLGNGEMEGVLNAETHDVLGNSEIEGVLPVEANDLLGNTHVEFPSFNYPKVNGGQLTCFNPTEGDLSCVVAFEHACASQLLQDNNDFTTFVCCTAEANDSATCFEKQNKDKLNEFNECVAQEHPTIKPDEILVTNSQKAQEAYPGVICPPVLTFDQKYDNCARFNFLDFPDDVICAMLAEGLVNN